MKALIIRGKGLSPEYTNYFMQEQENKVKVTIKASALNHRDLWIVKGQYAGLRYPIIPGSDGVGDYEGRRVVINPSHNWGENQDFQGAGYKILGLPDHGTMAQYCQVEEKYIYDAPEHLSDIEAAALPLAGLTAFRALFRQGSASSGQKVLISGIGGGVALFAMQFALAAGIEVFVTSGNIEKIDLAKEMGATDGFDYNDKDWAAQFQDKYGQIDLVIDGAAGDGFSQFPKVLRPGGRIVNYGGTMGKINGLVPQVLFWKQITIQGSTMGSDEDFRNMLDLVIKNRIKPVIDSHYRIENSNEAFEKMDRGEQFGKIVILH
jgi:NADPH:quinone reductase-like Zn-dependent oxidoreductase